MYRNLIIVLLICIMTPVFATDDNEIEVEFTPTSKEDMDKSKPSNVDAEDVKALLRFAGFEFELTQERDSRLVYRLHSASQQTQKGMATHQIKNFPVEALIFYAAIGASMARTAYTDSVIKGGRADPRWMENLLHEMTSPVGVLSFFAFVIFSGQTNVLYSKWLTTSVGPFTKGPLKGLKISRPVRGWLKPSLVENRLGYLRNRAIVSGRSGRYFGARIGRGFLASFGGQLGMAIGMLASNIVHEIDTIASFNPNFNPCMENLKNKITFNSENNDANSRRHCDLFYDELAHTVFSWGPGVASLISASLISHQLVNMAVGTSRLGARGVGIAANKTISSGFLKGAIIRSNARIPIASLARGATWLVPIPGFRIAKGGLKLVDNFLIPPVLQFLKWFGGSRNRPLFRFVNLYAFMETDALITTPLVNLLWTDNMKAGDVSDSISDFMRYYDVDYTTPICKDPTESECSEYHDMILTVQKTGLRFDGWRQYKIQMPMMAYHNWFKYVSNALSSVEETYTMYKNFVLAKQGVSSFNEVKYLSVEFEKLEKEGEETFFKKMVNIIDEYLAENENEKERSNEIDHNVVSISPSRFTKPELSLNNRDMILLLHALFSVQNSEESLKPFYGDDWARVEEENKKKVLDSDLNPNKLIKFYFDILENEFTSFKEELFNSVQKNYDSLTEQERENIQKDLNLTQELTIQHYRQYLLKVFFDIIVAKTNGFMKFEIEEAGERKKLLKEYIVKSVLPDEFNLPENAHFLKVLKDFYFERDETEPFLAWYFSGWDTLFKVKYESINPNDLTSDEAAQGFLTNLWEDDIVIIRNETLNQLPIDDSKVRDNLRKRVLAAGIEYLKETVESEVEARADSLDVIDVFHIEDKLGKNPDKIPDKVLWVYQRLLNLKEVFGDKLTKNIVLARLYEQMFIDVSEEGSEPKYDQVTPRPQGMHLVEAMNNLYQIKEEQFDIKYHPNRLEGIRTSYMIDFIVASALCGPDLSDQDEDLLSKEMGLSDKDPRSAFESAFAEEDIDDIMDAIPVFDRYFLGTDYSFHPPRIVTMDEEARKKICSGLFSGNTNRIIENIYDGRFLVGDKEYSSLLHLVLDHVGLEGISSEEDFNLWWFFTIGPYISLFQLAADREYKRVVETGFIEPFFNDDINVEDIKSLRINRSSNQSVLDQTVFISRKWFEEKNGRPRRGSSYPKKYSLALPEGTFHNMYFELLYWSDMILHFSQRRENSMSDEQLSSLKENLLKFADAFKPSENCSPEYSFLEMSIHCQTWAKNFLSSVKELDETVLSNIISLLGIDRRRLMQTTYPETIEIEGLSQEQIDNVKKVRNIHIGSFFCDNGKANIYECEPASLPQQFLNTSMIRFDKILKEATNYMIHIGNISEHQDVLSVTRSGGRN